MRLIKKIKSSFLKRFYIFSNGGYSIGSAYGARFLLDWRHPIDKKLAVGLFENDLLLEMIERIRAYRPDMFLDIGSHTGIYAIIAKTKLPNCEIHAFEPDSENLCQLRANLYLNKFHDSIKVYDFGLSDYSGEAFFDRTDNTGRGTRVVSQTGNQLINVMKLDDVLHDAEKKVYLKIDVEGHENSVLDGAKEFLTNNKCIIQVEIFPDAAKSIREKLHHMGYTEQESANEFDYYFVNFPVQVKAV